MDSEKVFDPDSLDRKSYQNVGLLFGPIIFIFMMLFSDHQDVMSMIAWRVAAVGLLMAIWWATEALPVAVTALVPLVTFDILEISSKLEMKNADALFISCTALPVLGILSKLESKILKPVLSSNQTLIWDTLRSIGYKSAIKGYGKLLEN